MKKNKTSKDQGLRLALQHRNEAAERMTPSADFADRLMQRIEEPRPRKKGRIKSLPYWGRLVGATAAASVLLLLTLHHYNNRGGELKEMPLAETQTVAADSSSNIKNEPMPTKVVEVPLVAEAKAVKRVRRTKKKQKVEVPDLKKDMPELLETEEAVIENQAQEIRPDVPDPYVLAAIQTQNIRSRGERLHNEVALIVSNQ